MYRVAGRGGVSRHGVVGRRRDIAAGRGVYDSRRGCVATVRGECGRLCGEHAEEPCIASPGEAECHANALLDDEETSPLIEECTIAEEVASPLPGENAVAYCGGHMMTGLDV